MTTSLPASRVNHYLVALLVLLGAQLSWAEDADSWPQWRGPARDGVWPEAGVLLDFAARELQPKWSVAINPGYAGPAVAGGRVFVTDRPGGDFERAVAFDAETGREVWQYQWPADYEGLDYASGPRATPTVDGDRVYVKGAMGALICLTAADGQMVWRRDLVADFGARVPTWGMVGAPLVDGGALIVNVGGSPEAAVIAFDKENGTVKWRRLDDRPGYAPPSIIEAGGKRQLIYWSAEALNSLKPENGESYWRVPFKDRADMTICSPVFRNNHLFVSSYYGGSLMLRLAEGRPAAEVVWQDQRGKPAVLALCISTPIFKGDHLYGVDRSGLLKCLEASSGKVAWETPVATGGKDHGNAHMIQHGGREILFDEEGDLIVADLNPAGYRELGRARIIAATAGVRDHRAVDWSHPAYAAQHIFVRNDSELRCVPLIDRRASEQK